MSLYDFSAEQNSLIETDPIARKELVSCLGSRFGRILHDDVRVPFTSDPHIDPMPWSSKRHIVIPMAEDSSSTEQGAKRSKSNITYTNVTYMPDHTMDQLAAVKLKMTTPRVAVKADSEPPVRIRWTLNLPHQVQGPAHVKFGDDQRKGPELPEGWHDQMRAWYMPPGRGVSESYELQIGNTPDMRDWSTVLDPREIVLPQPWWFSESDTNRVPLFLCRKSKMRLHYSFKLQILNLIQMIVKHPEQGWKRVTDVKMKMQKLVGIDESTTLPIPTMIGTYYKLREVERRTLSEDSERNPIKILATSIKTKSTRNAVSAGSSQTLEYICHTPVYELHFVAVNTLASKFSNHSHYIVDPAYMCGRDRIPQYPIERVEHQYGSEIYDQQTVQDYSFTPGSTGGDFQSAPIEPGYGVYAFTQRERPGNPGTGKVLNENLNASSTFHMRSDDDSGSLFDSDFDDLSDPSRYIEKATSGHILPKSRNQYDIYLFMKTKYMLVFRHNQQVIIDDGTPVESDKYEIIA